MAAQTAPGRAVAIPQRQQSCPLAMHDASSWPRGRTTHVDLWVRPGWRHLGARPGRTVKPFHSHSNHTRKIDMQTTFQWTRARVLTLLVLAALVAAFAGAAVAYSGSPTTALSSGATAKHGADDPAGDDRG